MVPKHENDPSNDNPGLPSWLSAGPNTPDTPLAETESEDPRYFFLPDEKGLGDSERDQTTYVQSGGDSILANLIIKSNRLQEQLNSGEISREEFDEARAEITERITARTNEINQGLRRGDVPPDYF